jgi:hypothetical protein
VAVAATALLLALGVGPAASQTSTGSATTVPPAGASGLTLVSQSAWVAPVGSFDLTVDAGTVAADAQIVARIYVPINTQAQLQRVAKGQGLGARVQSVTLPAAGVARGTDGSLQLSYPLVATLPHPANGFFLANPGVYPFSLAVVSASGQTVGQLFTELVRLPAASSSAGGAVATSGTGRTTANPGAAPLSVALVVPFGASAVGHRPDRAATLASAAVSALDGEADVLARYPTVPLAVAPVPETIDTQAEQDRTSGTHLVTDVRTAIGRRAVLSGPYVTVDSGAWVAHGLSGGYDQQLQAGAAALAPLGAGVTRATAVLDPTATPDSLGRLAAQGTNTVVVLDDHLAPTAGRTDASVQTPLTQWFDLAESNGSHLSAVPADADLSGQLSTGADPVLAAHQVLAALALVSLDHSGSQACIRQPGQPCRRGVALELPADPARAQITLDPLLAALASPAAGGAATPLVQATSVTTFTSQVDPSSASDRTTSNGTNTLRHLDARPVAGLGAYPAHFNAVTADIASFRTMSSDPAGRAVDLANAWQQLALASGSTQLGASQRLAYLDAIDADLQGQVSQVTAQSQQTVTLTSASGKIPFSISNALDYPVRVVLDFQSPKLHFVEGNSQTVTIAAGQPAHLTIPVTVRASGAFPMQVSISSPDHGLAIAHTRFDVRSTAISQLGLALTVAAGLFLALWWIRNARSTRRRRSLVDSTHPVLRT